MSSHPSYKAHIGRECVLLKKCYVVDSGHGKPITLYGCGRSNFFPEENPQSYIRKKTSYGRFLDVLNEGETFTIKSIHYVEAYSGTYPAVLIELNNHKYKKPVDATLLFALNKFDENTWTFKLPPEKYIQFK